MILPFMDSGIRAFINRIGKHRILTKAEERELLRRVKEGDERALREIVNCNLKFVIRVAIRYQDNGLSLDALIAEGAIGLREAARRYDVAQNLRFLSYAVWWIRQAMIRALETQTRLIRISAYHEANLKRYRAMPLEQQIGGDYVPRESETGKPFPPYMREALASTSPASLDHPLGGSEVTPAAFIYSADVSPEDWTATHETTDSLARLVHTLTPKERRVISLLFGLDSGHPMNLRQVADLLRLSRERIRQIRGGALGKMRKRAGQSGLGASPRPGARPRAEGTS